MENVKRMLKRIELEIKKCKKCRLYKTRINPVPGKGNIYSRILLIGEAPGYMEDLKGEPFVGRAGKLLDEFLLIAGLKREDVFITNVVKCRPPNNRKPKKEEIEACSPYLEKQIRSLKPKLIITLGNVATSFIFKKFGMKPKNMKEIHGNIFSLSSLSFQSKIIPMYHPASVLRNPNLKKIIREDWKKVRLLR